MLEKSYGQTKNYPRDQMIIDLGFERWNKVPEGYNERWYSHNFTLSLLKDIVNENNGLSLAIGGAVAWHHHHSDLYWDELGRYDLRSENYSKNKITTVYFDVPIEFRFRAVRDKRGRYFRTYLGAKVGYNVSNWNLYVDNDSKYKRYRTPGMNDWRYGVYVRIGWNWVSIFGQYSLSPLFEDGHAIEVYPYSVGISLMAF